MVSNPRNVDVDRSVDCVFCDDLADERRTVDLWNNPRFPDGEAHSNCYEVWEDQATYVVLDLDSLTAHHPDSPDAGNELLVGVRSAHLSRDRAEDLAEGKDRYVVVETTGSIWPEY